jgi:hypothetical protein
MRKANARPSAAEIPMTEAGICRAAQLLVDVGPATEPRQVGHTATPITVPVRPVTYWPELGGASPSAFGFSEGAAFTAACFAG